MGYDQDSVIKQQQLQSIEALFWKLRFTFIVFETKLPDEA